MDIIAARLTNQHLLQKKFTTPKDVLKWFYAVQSQDYPAAKWAIGQRIEDITDAAIEDAFNKGEIIRTHVMRPTWHFILPENLKWMQQITAHRVKALMKPYNKKLELDDALFQKTTKLFQNALQKHKYITRQEIKKLLHDNNIQTDVQRLSHIMMYPELDGIICSGPRHGKQFTYALVDEQIKQSRTLSKEEGLAELAFGYFQSHGPAQLRDFAWWSGLTKTEAKEALSYIEKKLQKETIAEKVYYFVSSAHIPSQKVPHVLLISIFDEYTIAYNDRTALSEKRDIERMISMGNALTAVVIVNGKVAGTWKRILRSKEVTVIVRPFRPFSNQEKKALEKAVGEYAHFVRLEPSLEVIQ